MVIINTSSADIRDIYCFNPKVIGDGSFGSVRKAHRYDNPTKEYAVKSLKKKKINDQKLLEQELEILSSLDHPNIIQFFEFYQDDIYFHIIMELCTGTELFDYILKNEIQPEDKIKELMFKIVSAILYSHFEGITHRDLKLENMIFENLGNDCQLKIIDWGLSSKFEIGGKPLSTITGTYQYIAPEVFNGSYDNKCDIWSIGVIAFIMFTKTYPFMGKDIKEYLENIKKESVVFKPKYFEKVSLKAVEFLNKCIEKDPKKRFSIEQCYNHEWFGNIRKRNSTSSIDPTVLAKLRSYEKPTSRLRSFIAAHFVNLILKPDEIKELRNQFQLMDLNGQGYITLDELRKAYERGGIEVHEDEIRYIVDNIDSSKNNMLNYSEFLIAAVDQNKILDKENLIKIFNYFDEDNSGYIDKKNLQSLLQRTMKNRKTILRDDEFLDIIGEIVGKDEEDSDKIYLEDFLSFFNQDNSIISYD